VIKLKRNFPAEIAITDFHYFREASIKELPANVGWAKNPRPFQTLLFDNGAACYLLSLSANLWQSNTDFFSSTVIERFFEGKR
jgi:hypothetical protein